MEDIPTNINDYIIKSRQSGIIDSKIIETLKSSNWPDDIIIAALKKADLVIPAVPEPTIENTQAQSITANTLSQNQFENKKQEKIISEENREELEKPKNQENKKFCYLTLLSLLFSPIPFVGLGIAMSSFERIKKNNMSGVFIAVIGLLINISVILFILYFIVQLLTMNPTQLEGVSKYIVERLGIL